VKEYDLFMPLYYNDGSPVEPDKILELKRRLLDQFDGLTFFPQANEGFWRAAGVTYRDEILVFRVLTSDSPEARAYFAELKEELKRELKQEEILIVQRDVDIL